MLFVGQMMMYWDKSYAGEVPAGDVRVPFGKAAIRREGADVTLISYGRQVHDCAAAAEWLGADGVSREVIDLRTLVP